MEAVGRGKIDWNEEGVCRVRDNLQKITEPTRNGNEALGRAKRSDLLSDNAITFATEFYHRGPVDDVNVSPVIPN